ncbi:Type II/IV secretion system secretin RcpA/CpaC, associated with Flp pilus assembly [hydrothermal vent metagenome]|uniref:Type II/IV secretion system secretin RcpA/CpaC, associated with Flp pilus assembly n=1 Tax=hydrothermal vent metagenome TaxID=652676 RepID=A0A3B1DH05_9ZZZZ
MQYLSKLKKRILIPTILLGLAALPLFVVQSKSTLGQEDNSQVATDPVVHISKKKSNVKVVKQFSKVIQMDHRIKRVDGFNPDILKVTPLGTKAIRIYAVEPGVTSLTLVDETNKVYSIEVLVTGDVRHLQAYISELFPKDSVHAVEVSDAVLLRGWVTQPEHITELTELAEQFYPRVLNQMKVGGEQRVVLRVKIMEAQRTKIRKMGFNFLYVNSNSVLSSAPGKLGPLGALAASAVGVPPAAAISAATLTDPTIAFGIVDKSNAFTGFLEALKEESLLKILAEPNLVATNGRPANMHSGGEFPILVPSTLGNVSIEFKKFGTKLEAVPVILGNGRVRLELHPSVSEKDFSTAVQVGNILVPGIKIRQVNTMVEMKFGETLMIAGLLQKQQIATTSKVPILGDMPWVGTFFSRKSFNDSETELVIMVTPELVAPLAANQVPYGGPGQFTETPTDKELYIDNMIEVPSYRNHSPHIQGIAPTTLPSILNPHSSGITPLQPGRNGRFAPAPNQQQQIIPPQPPQLPPAPTTAVKEKTAYRPTSRRRHNRNRYALPVWARKSKPDPFAGPDPARQVGFTTESKNRRNKSTRSQLKNPFKRQSRRQNNSRFNQPSRNFFVPN